MTDNKPASRILSSSIKLVLFCSLLSLAAVPAIAGSIYGDWHYSGDTFTTDGDVFMVTHLNFDDPSIILSVNQQSYVIREESCKVLPTRKYCVEQIYRDLEDATEDDPLKFEDGRVYAGIRIVIYSRGPDIDVSTSYSDTSPELNEEVKVDVTLKNEGEEATSDFYYEVTLPEEAYFTGSSYGTERLGRTLTYGAYLSTGETDSFSYSFKVTDYTKFQLRPKAHFSYEGVQNNLSLSSQTIQVNKPYSYSFSLSPGTVEAGDQSALVLKVENEVSDPITIEKMEIVIPDYLSVQAKPGEMEKNNNKYSWSGELEADESKIISLLVKPVKSGEYELSSSIKVIDIDEKEFSESEKTTLTSKITDIKPILSVKDQSLSEGADFRVAFSLENKNSRVGFRNIKARVWSEAMPDLTAELDELLPGQVKTLIVNDSLSAPFLDEKKAYDVHAEGSYDTTTNEAFEFSTKKTLTVTPVKDALSIVQEPSTGTVEAGKNFSFTAKIRNNNQEDIQVNVKDDYPAMLTLIGGKTDGYISFGSSGTKKAYTYSLKVPLDYEMDYITITTTASIASKGYKTNKSTKISVTHPEPLPDEEAEEKEQAPVNEPEEKEEKPGFFKKVINEVTGFFRRLLGMD